MYKKKQLKYEVSREWDYREGLMEKRQEGTFWGVELFCSMIVVVVIQLHIFTKPHQIAQLKLVGFIVYTFLSQ